MNGTRLALSSLVNFRRFASLAIASASLAALSPVHAQGKWDVVLNGRAVHMHASREWNENNWGLGVEREFSSTSRWVKVALANGFRDSMDHLSYMAGGGIKRRFRLFDDRFYIDLGAIGFVMTREDVNHNAPFPGVLPALTLGTKHVAINVTYLPERAVDGLTNANRRDPTLNGILFIQCKLDVGLFRPGARRRVALASSNP